MKVFVICDEKDHFLQATFKNYPSTREVHFSPIFDRTVYFDPCYEEVEQIVYSLVEKFWPGQLKICSFDITLTLVKEFSPS